MPILIRLLFFVASIAIIDCRSAPLFSTLPKDETTAFLGESVTLPCAATGSPPPKVSTWLLNDEEVNLQSGRHFLRKSGELHISKTEKADTGYYQCVAKNEVGGVASEKKRLFVAYFDRFVKSNVIDEVTQKENEYYIAKVPEIQCEPKPSTKYIWYKDNTPVKEDDRIQVSEDGDLYISHLKFTHRGVYKLVVENTFMSTKGKSYARQDVKEFRMNIQGKVSPDEPQVIYTSQGKTAGQKKTTSVVLECFISGMINDVGEITWFKLDTDGVPRDIPVDARHIRSLSNRRLEIKNPTYVDDNGIYRCSPRSGLNFFKKQTKDLNLIVSSVPEFITDSKIFPAQTDGSVTLNCVAQGSPKIDTRWYRNGLPLPKDGATHTVLANNTIILNKLDRELDNGIFQCGAENYAGLFFINLELQVRNVGVQIIGELKNYYIHFNFPAVIPCQTIGAPKPTVTWTYNNNRRIYPDSKYSIDNNGSLVIKTIQASDEGIYTCTASNPYDTAYRTTNVYAVNRTRISKFPPAQLSVVKGDSPLLSCEVEHDKRVNFTRVWWVAKLPIEKGSTKFVVEKDGGLRVNFIKPEYTNFDFTCYIFAEDGNYSKTTVLVLENRPFQPSSPRIVGEPRATLLNLIWDAPSDGGSPIIHYVLSMKNYTQSRYVKIAEVKAPDTIYTVINLQAGSKYRFQVAAKNQYGYGEKSAEPNVWLETKTTQPSGVPLQFKSVDAGTEYIVLKWLAPLLHLQNGQLNGYSLRYRVAGYGGANQFTTRDLESLATEYRMEGLPLFTKYEVQLAAYNKAGRGPWTDSIFIETLQGVPVAAPTNVKVSVVNSTTVMVSFTSPRQELWNGKLTRIVALYWPPEKPQDQQHYETNYDTSNINQQTFALPHLQANREYVLAVQVKTTGGPSPGSQQVQFKTTEGRPDSVRDLQVSNTYSDAFTVTWKAPLKPNGVLQGYRVRYRVFSSTQWTTITEVGRATGAVVGNLAPKTKYEVEVFAYTNGGEGTPERRSATTIEKPELPKAPSDLKAYNVWGNIIALGWTPGYSGRAVILHYQIQYNNETDYYRDPQRAIWRDIKNVTKILMNPANVTYLKPNSIYRFRMKAYNRVGPSRKWSNVSKDIATGEGIPTRPPTGLIATAPGTKQLLIKWKPPPKDSWNSGSIRYQFIIRPIDQDPKIKDVYKNFIDTQATSYLALGLRMYTMYNVTMRLYNDKGHGPWSGHLYARTSEDHPSGYPINVRAVVKSSSAVQVMWGPVPVHQRNGVITGYKVFYQLQNYDKTELFKDFPGNTTFSGIIDNLNGYSDYEFRVMAYTKVGGKLKSPPVTRKTYEGRPSKPTNVRFTEVNYQYVELEWSPPLKPNGQLSRYRVHYRKNVTGAIWISVPVSPFNPRSARVDALTFNHYYEFKIEATNSIDWGEPAIELVLVTSVREIPDSPIVLAIPSTSIRHSSVIVEWRPRGDGNGPIRAYNLQYNLDGSGWKNYQHGIPPTEILDKTITMLEVKFLEPATKYQFRVRAVNDIGPSVWSDSSKTITTLQRAPSGAPHDVRVVRKTPTSLTISWKRPEIVDLSSSIAGYRIEYRFISSTKDLLKINTNDVTFEYTLSGLRIFTLYEVRLGVLYQQGGGATWTNSYKWRTGESAPLVAPTNVKVSAQGKSAVRVTWSAPDETSVNGYVLGYKIEARRLGPGRRRRRRRSSSRLLNFVESIHRRSRRGLVPVCTGIPDVTTHLAGPYSNAVTLKNLKKYTRYQITVRVYNSFTDGPKSIPARYTTPKDVPGPPYILSDRQYTDLVEVDFAEPCEPNGKVIGFRVRIQKSGEPFSLPTDYGASQRRIRVTGLTKNTKYILELSAKTDLGYGQKATIEFHTKGTAVLPGRPGTPSERENKAGFLVLQWDEGPNGNAPVTKFELQYRKGSGALVPFRDISPEEVRYDGSTVVYMPFSLKADDTYRFRVQSTTKIGTSPWSDWSKAIKPMTAAASNKPVHEEIWFIFLMIILLLIILVVIIVCCWRCQRGKDKYNTNAKGYNMSSFEMAMVQQQGRGGSDTASAQRLIAPSRNGSSYAPSVANSSMRKSVAKSASSGSLDDLGVSPRGSPPSRPEGSIANHYNNDPFHKTWADSLDKKTKKEILAGYGKRRPSQHSVDSLEEKKRVDPVNDRASRARPGRKDINEMRNLARSQPELIRDENPYNKNPIQQQQQQRYSQPRRPGKRPVDQELARSVPDLNRQYSSPGDDSQITRQSSFLRATGGENSDDNESLHEIFEREKTKRELAMELDHRMDGFYPNSAPPPYEYNVAPPAYSPSDVSDTDYLVRKPSGGGYNSDYGRSRPPPPSNRGPPPDRGYYNPEREYQRGSDPRGLPPQSPSRFPPRDLHYPPPPPSSSEPPGSPYTSSSDHHFAPPRNFSPPSNAYIDDDTDGGDYPDGDYPDGDMTLV